eukprot:2965761-Pleurochrysis_carterae.AAC.1
MLNLRKTINASSPLKLRRRGPNSDMDDLHSQSPVHVRTSGMTDEQFDEEEALCLALKASLETTPNGPPQRELLSASISLAAFAKECEGGSHADLLRAKLRALEHSYSGMRHVAGDGNCFYRGLWAGWMERLAALPQHRRRIFRKVAVQLKSEEAAERLPAERAEEVRALGRAFAAHSREVCEDAVGGESALLRAASQAEPAAASLRWLRLLASAHIRAHWDQYEPYAEGLAMEAYCVAQVETMGIEADEPQADERKGRQPPLQSFSNSNSLSMLK